MTPLVINVIGGENTDRHTHIHIPMLVLAEKGHPPAVPPKAAALRSATAAIGGCLEQ